MHAFLAKTELAGDFSGFLVRFRGEGCKPDAAQVEKSEKKDISQKIAPDMPTGIDCGVDFAIMTAKKRPVMVKDHPSLDISGLILSANRLECNAIKIKRKPDALRYELDNIRTPVEDKPHKRPPGTPMTSVEYHSVFSAFE